MIDAPSLLSGPWPLAHSMIKGLGEFQNGFIHPFMTPVHVLALVTFGLWLSRLKPFEPAKEVGTFAASSALGLIAVLVFPRFTLPLLPLLLATMAVAGVISSGWREPRGIRLAGLAVAGALLGIESAPDFWLARADACKSAAGSWAALQVGLLCVSYYTSLLPDRKWASYGVRIIASWVIAIAVMVIAFLYRRAS
ncbi:HupE/UreJ family protein [Luteolibacter soli]|uniref:HupE/UreJ family protein n=1 Tax=Luteolibacter soli TaxID=3135280 RepID=A0ABU9AN61_9BACT